ncbi:uncharacterized protein LOC144111192 [Amblyomma americanum]|uniref:RING-type domain-containing protein n=1 Tax=Amblyomma americanum TaxID=6943 RepID=A0AAQ4F5F2_AMBAM
MEEDRGASFLKPVNGWKMRSRLRSRLNVAQNAAIPYDREQWKAARSLSRVRGDRYVLKDFGFCLDRRPIRFVQPVKDLLWMCSMCDEVPASPQFLRCGHVMCIGCLAKVGSFGYDGVSGALCPRDGMRFKFEEVRSKQISAGFVFGMLAHCFNVDYGCQFQATLQHVEKHYVCCPFRPDRMPRDVPAMDVVRASSSGRKSDGTEDIVRQLSALKTDTSAHDEGGNHLLGAVKPSASTAAPAENAAGDGASASTDPKTEWMVDSGRCPEFMLMNVSNSFLREVD